MVFGSNQNFMNTILIFLHNIKNSNSEHVLCMNAPADRATNVMTNYRKKETLLKSCKNAVGNKIGFYIVSFM